MTPAHAGAKLNWIPKGKHFRKGTQMTTVNIHSGRKGDVVVISGHRVGERERLGEILEVLGEADRSRYRVRWDGGSESVFVPGSDAAISRSRSSGPPRRSA